ncbi:MAG: tRNA 2-selenouridine(34) synthase MnmH [Bacteroidales bacterium]|nr:tRNA 2-selenouridine(34) synthase MnmH [Bacteroidales bacterium]
MQKTISIQEFLELAGRYPVVDVRSPAEFDHGHFPEACNIPLFSNEERAIVGTIFTRENPEKALKEGLKIVGPKMVSFVEMARNIARHNTLLLYCWRGGKRSHSLAWLFETAGMNVYVLEGGYRAYRRHLKASFCKPLPMIIVGGMTGSGKTEILYALQKRGEQIIDLEGLANHKGSVFGSLGQAKQPTTEQFENNLFLVWNRLNPHKTIWIEDESKAVGRVYIPDELFNQMKTAPLVDIALNRNYRIERLVRDYAGFNIEDLIVSVQKIERRLGGLNASRCIEAIRNKDFPKAADILLYYYDKTYRHAMSSHRREKIIQVDLTGNDPEINAGIILSKTRELQGDNA